MKTPLASFAGLLLIGFAGTALGQNYSIDWSSIDGGGGTSSGGNYSLSGTIGQPDAGVMSGGSFVLTGGFWSFEPSVEQPRLFISRGGGGALISWSPGMPGFVLQANNTLAPAGWADAPTGGTNPVSVLATNATRFYRLRK